MEGTGRGRGRGRERERVEGEGLLNLQRAASCLVGFKAPNSAHLRPGPWPGRGGGVE